MTRENKLALVVGFGLILFVGILISDHFSVARNQASAELASVADPLAVTRTEPRDLFDLRPRTQAQPVAPSTLLQTGEPAASSTTLALRDAAETLTMGALPEPAASQVPGFVPVPGQVEIPLARQTYEVRPGESLFGICRAQYGDTSLVAALARFNNLDDPASLQVGQRLQIPPAELIGGRTATRPSVPAAREVPSRSPKPSPSYVVKNGDSLSAIAQRCLGDRAKWRQLYELNRHVIDDPDNLRVGTVLKLL